MDVWVTTAVDESSLNAAKALGLSLRNVGTRKNLLLVMADSLGSDLTAQLDSVFDDVVKTNLATSDTESMERAARETCFKIRKIQRGIYLSPYVNVSENIDSVFENVPWEGPSLLGGAKDAVLQKSSIYAFTNIEEKGKNPTQPSAESPPRIFAVDKFLHLKNSSISLALKHKTSTEPIAIVGMSCRFPQAAGPRDFWKLILSQEDAVGRVPAARMEQIEGWDATTEGGFLSRNVAEIDGAFFEMSRGELNVTDPQQRLALEVSWEALEDARMDPTSLKGAKLGVFSGSWRADYRDLLVGRKLVSTGALLRPFVGNGGGALPGRLSFFFGGIGPSVATDSACSSSMAALGLAVSSLRNGTSDVALAVGVNILLNPFTPEIDPLLSPDGRCKTFEEGADGFGRAEGVATLVLKRLSDAQRDGDRVHALLRGVGSCTKATEGSLATPDVEGEALSMQLALEDAGVCPGDVEFVECHGTGTSVGDFVEFQAVSKVYGVDEGRGMSTFLGSVKANIGHTEACSGLAGVIKTTLALKEKLIPPHRRIRQMNAKIDVAGSARLRIPHEAIPWGVSPGGRRLAGVSSFGIVGNYYHVILEDYAKKQAEHGKKSPLPWNILTFSAKSEFSLKETMKKYLTFWDNDSRPSISDVAFSSSTTRAHLRPFRASFVANSSWNDVEIRLEKADSFVKKCVRQPRVCFLLTGQGSQWFGMGRQLYATHPTFAAAFDACHAILKSRHDVDLVDYLWENPTGFSDSKVLHNQTGIFVMEFCMSKFLASLGVSPSVVLGHSVGEFASACVAEILSVEDALSLIVHRAKLLLASRQTGKSAMLAVKAKSTAISAIISEYARRFADPPPEIAALNSVDQIVLGGSEETIRRTKEIVESRGIVCVLLATSHAFHSSLMNAILPAYVNFAATVSHKKPKCRFLPSVSGRTAEVDVTDWPQFWSDVTRKPVDFLGASQSDALKDVDVFVEIGPQPVLSGLIAKNIPTSKTVATLRRGVDDAITFAEALSSLYTLGVDVNWTAFYAPFDVATVDLPLYEFDRRSFWFTDEEGSDVDANNSAAVVHPLLGTHTWTAHNFHLFDAPVDLKRRRHVYLNDHSIADTFVFPAAAHVEIALATANFLDKKDGESVVVENLEISAPLGKDDDNVIRIQTTATPKDAKFHVEVFSRDDSEGSGKWKSHANCTAYGISPDMTPRQDYVKLTQEELKEGTSTSDLYANLFKLGYTFGPNFQRLVKFWKLPRGTTVFHVDLRHLESSYAIHPVLIDAIFQAALLQNGPRKSFSVPAAITKFTAVASGLPGDSAFIHVIPGDHDSLTHFAVLNERQDSLVAVMEGLTLVDTTPHKIKAAVLTGNSENPRILKQFWKKSSSQPTSKLIPLNLNSIFRAVTSEDAVDVGVVHGDDYALLGEVIGLHYQKTLLLLGLPTANGANFTADEMADQLQIIPALRRFFRLILDVLTEDAVLQRIGTRFSVNNVSPLAQIDAAIAAKSALISKIRAEIPLISACLQNLPQLLRGQASVLPILFPTDVDVNVDVSAEKFYQQMAWYSNANAVLVNSLRRALQESRLLESAGKEGPYVLRVLEVGGGTGATTAAVVTLLESLDISYHYEFTDISPAFFPAIEEKIRPKMTGGKGSFHCSVFDLEVDALSQGFRPFEFDVVVASLVLHATSNLSTTLSNLRKVTAGILTIFEGAGPRRNIDAVFGAVEGYWLYDDAIRTTHPNVNGDKWVETLASCGFTAQHLTWDGVVILLAQANASASACDLARAVEAPRWVAWIPAAGSLRENLGELCAALGRLGRNVVLVENAEEADAATNSRAPLEGVFFAAGMAEDPQTAQTALKDFLHFTQILAQRFTASAFPRIVVPTRGIWFFDETDDPSASPASSSTLWGLCKTLRSEYPGINVKTIDVTSETLPLNVWLAELFPCDEEPQIAIRGGERFLLRLTDATKQIDAASIKLTYPTASAFQVALPSSRAISDLSFVPFKVPRVGESQVKIDVTAVGLNFRDVFSVLKPNDVFSKVNGFGMDIAGIVTAIGSDVGRKDVKVGDRVAVVDLHRPFSSTLVTDTSSLIKLPAHWSLEDGATLSTPFITAHFSLITVAQMTSHDTLLIHTATGGVGLAAIQLAQQIGARIVATAGSKRKRAYLKRLGIDVVLNSRSVEFGAEIISATNGRGVDVVLNSLTGEGFVETSLKCCANNARFVEMSKLNVWSKEDVAAMRPDVTYSIVDVSAFDASTMNQVSKNVEELISAGKIRPLPRVEFPASRVTSALEYLSEGRHIGKVVLKLPSSPSGGTWRDDLFSADGLFLITGGFGGIGIEIAKWIVANGGRHILLTGRRPLPGLVEETVELLLSMGALTVKPLIFDVGDEVETRRQILGVTAAHPSLPLKGIFHVAGVLNDAALVNQTYAKFEETLHPKWRGTLNLHRLSVELNFPLDYFVLFSATAALVGTPGQANHAAANAAMDAIAWHRHSLGLPATTVNWGQWGQIGVAAELNITALEAFTPESALRRLETALLSKEVHVAITSDMRLHANTFPWATATYFNDGSAKPSTENPPAVSTHQPLEDFHSKWESATERHEKHALLEAHLSATVRSVLRIEPSEFVDLSVSLFQLGMDSLMMIQLNNKMEKDLNSLALTFGKKFSNAETVASIAANLLQRMEAGSGGVNDLVSENMSPQEYSKLIAEDSKLPVDFVRSVKPFPRGGKVSNVLLTGATGHLGTFLLHQLCANDVIDRVFCLLRKGGKVDGLQRLKDMVRLYGISQPNWNKVVVVEGALTEDRLGLDVDVYEQLTSTIDGVIHSAAKVNHVETYRKESGVDGGEDLRTVNTGGLNQILKFTCAGKPKKLYYASTYVATRQPDVTSNTMNENWANDGEFDACVDLGYATSKFVGENLVKAAIERGLTAYVFRLPSISGNVASGVLRDEATNHHLLRFMSYLQTRAMPNSPTPLNMISVDVCAKLSLDVFLSDAAEGGVYNVMNPKPNRESDFISVAKEEFGVTLELVEFDEYVKRMKRDGEKSVLTPFMQLYETREILKVFTLNPSHSVWLQNEGGFYKSERLSRIFGSEYVNMESSVEAVTRDLKTALQKTQLNLC